MNGHLSVIQALGVYGSIGAEYIKFQLELHFFIESSMFIWQVYISSLVLIVDVN